MAAPAARVAADKGEVIPLIEVVMSTIDIRTLDAKPISHFVRYLAVNLAGSIVVTHTTKVSALLKRSS